MKSKDDFNFNNGKDYEDYLISYYSGLLLQALVINYGSTFINLPSSDGSIEDGLANRSKILATHMAKKIIANQ